MSDRRATWTVEIDASQAEAQAQKIRNIFTRALADIMPASSTGAGPAAALEAATSEAKELKTALGEVAKANPAASLDEFKRGADDAARRVRILRDEYEKMIALAGTYDRTSRASRARFNDHVESVRKNVGDEEANRVRNMGRSVNIGQRGAEFADDQLDYHAAERDALAISDKNTQKRRYTAEENVKVAQLQAQLYQAEYDASQASKAAAQAQMQAFEKFNWDTASEDEINTIVTAAAEADETLKKVAEEEEDLLKTAANANKKAAGLAEKYQEKIARDAAKQAGEIHVKGTATATPTGAAAYTQQTALTVSKASVDNAAALVVELREATALARELKDIRIGQNESGRSYELQTAREIAQLQKQSKIETEQELTAIRQKAAAEKQAATETAAAEKAAAAERSAALKAAAAERSKYQKDATGEIFREMEATKKAASEKINAEKRAYSEIRRELNSLATAEERIQVERTRILKREIDKRTREEKKAAREAEKAAKQAGGASKGIGLPFGGMNAQSMIGGAMAMTGIYGMYQIPGQLYEAGKTGAMQARQAETFSGLAERLDLDGNAIIGAVKKASNETITDMDAMSLSAQLMAGKFSQGRTTIVSDIAVMVEASRAFSKVFTDEQGNFLSTQEVYARLVKYIREGNKELVDQFGLSNQRIAQALGVSVDGMASAQGAALRMDGLIKVLKEDLDRLPDAAADGAGAVADAFEQAEARTKQAEQRGSKAWSRPMSAWAGFTAGVAEQMFVRTPDQLADQVGTQQRRFETDVQMKDAYGARRQSPAEYLEEKDALLQVRNAIGLVDAAQKAGYESADLYAGALQDIVTAYEFTGEYTQNDIDLTREIAEWFSKASAAAGGLTSAVDGTAAAMAGAITPTAQLIGQLMTLAGIGMIPITIATDLLDPGTIGKLGGVENIGKLQQNQWAAPPGTPTGEYLRAFGPRDDLGQMSPGQRAANEAELQGVYDIRRIREQEEKAAATKAASEWKSASDKAAAAFEQAAKDSASAFKTKIDAIPGLTGGSSEITQTQLDLAKAGVGQSFADDYVRQLNDEIDRGKDLYPNVSIDDARRRANIDPKVPDKLVGQVFQEKWNSGELFANPQNLEIINMDAVNRDSAAIDQAAKGKQNIYSYLGLDVANSPLDTPGKNAFAEMIGLGEGEAKQAGTDARAQFSEAFYNPAAAGAGGGEAAGSGGSFATSIVAEIKTATQEGQLSKDLADVGAGMIGAIYGGFSLAAKNQSWGAPIIESLAAEIAPTVFNMLQEQFN